MPGIAAPSEHVQPCVRDTYRWIVAQDSLSTYEFQSDLISLTTGQLLSKCRELENLAFKLAQQEEEEIERLKALNVFSAGDSDAMA